MPRQPTPIRYAIYTRQSTESHAVPSSCKAQFETCREHARSSGEKLYWIGQRFDDEGFSGDTLDRPALKRLRKVIEQKKIQRLYITALDRLSRRTTYTLQLMDECDRAGVEIHAADLPSGPANADTQLLRNIMASFAEFEREMIKERLADTRSYLKQHGRRLAGKPPYGYDADHETKQLIPNRGEARRVRAIFKMAAEGLRPSEITERINRKGWRTKIYVAKRTGNRTGGGKWTTRQVTALLRNPIYRGRFRDGETTREGSHEALVDEVLFQSVQDQIDRRKTTQTSGGGGYKIEFPLRGKVICPKCKRTMSPYSIPRKKGQAKVLYRYYRCRSTAGGRPPCRGSQYDAYELERRVGDYLAANKGWFNLLKNTTGRAAKADACRTMWNGL